MTAPVIDALDGVAARWSVVSDDPEVPILRSAPVPAREAWPAWRTAVTRLGAIGLTPVLLGETYFAEWEDALAQQRAPTDPLLAWGDPPPVGPVLSDREQMLLQRDEAFVETARAELESQTGGLPGADRFVFAESDEPTVMLALGCAPAMVPLLLTYGGWNDCPLPADHAAVLGRWHARFGARWVHVDTSSVALWVDAPPSDSHEVAAVLWQRFLYSAQHHGAHSETSMVRSHTWSVHWR